MHYSDPTANRALGPINREFNRLEKQAKDLCRRRLTGQLSDAAWEKALRRFTGIYRQIPTFAMKEVEAELQKEAEAS